MDYSALLVLNGTPPSLSTYQEFAHSASLKIAVDGGVSFFLKNDLYPDLIIGDLDSIPNQLQLEKEKLITLTNQDFTDTEKAIEYLAKKGILNFKILGSFGERSDHFLYHCFLLKKFSDLKINLVSENENLFIAKDDLELSGEIGQRISFFPLFEKVFNINSTGLEYELNGKSMEMGIFASISNRFAQQHLKLSFQGYLLFVLERV